MTAVTDYIKQYLLLSQDVGDEGAFCLHLSPALGPLIVMAVSLRHLLQLAHGVLSE